MISFPVSNRDDGLKILGVCLENSIHICQTVKDGHDEGKGRDEPDSQCTHQRERNGRARVPTFLGKMNCPINPGVDVIRIDHSGQKGNAIR